MEEKQVHKGRIILLISLIVIVFVAFALKLMQYQIVNAEEYKEMAQGNYTRALMLRAVRSLTVMAGRLRSIRSAMTL